MNTEDYFISLFEKKSNCIGDDGCIKGDFVYSKDAFFENVHFKRTWMSAYEIAYKAMAVNISDAISMNAAPLYALLAVAIPKSLSRQEIQSLYEGFQSAADEYGIEIIGGDTIANSKLDITVTIISKTKSPLFRKGIKVGDYIAYTGDLGRSSRDLKRLLRGFNVNSGSRFIKPTLRSKFIFESAKCLSAGMDISDGLFRELNRLSKINRVGFEIYSDLNSREKCSGEEYEMLIAIPPKHLRRVQNIAAKNRVPLNVFARAKRGKFMKNCKANHF